LFKVLFVVYYMIMPKSNWFGLDLLPYWALFLNVALFFWVWDVERLGPFRAHHCPDTIRGWRTLCYLKKYTNFNTFVNPNKDGRKWLCWSLRVNAYGLLFKPREIRNRSKDDDLLFKRADICALISRTLFKRVSTCVYRDDL
jgi:hypothetical protein